jgi:putative ABC transport system permease protein
MRNKELGFDKDNIVWLEMRNELSRQYPAFKRELLNNPNILGLTRSTTTLNQSESSAEGRELNWEGRLPDDNFPGIKVYGVDADFLKTFNMEMVEGRFFSDEFATDRTEAFVVNEAAVKAMGIDSPVGKRFSLFDFKGFIIGVVEDFNFRSLHYKIEPLVMKMGWGLDNILIRISGNSTPRTLGYIEKTVKNFIPNYSFRFEFLDTLINSRYRQEMRLESVIKYLTSFAIFVSCLGLLGLASFLAEQRTKEIGIRKVLGASVSGIVVLLSKEFGRLVLVANIAAWPIAYFVLRSWLQNFAFRINIGIWIFFLSAFVALIIALMTVCYQALRAALANPVNSLRYE